MKILVCDPISPKGIELLQQRPEFQVTVLPKRLSEAELLPIVGDVVAMIVRSETKVTKKVLEAATKLRVVGRAGVGGHQDNLQKTAIVQNDAHFRLQILIYSFQNNSASDRRT